VLYDIFMMDLSTVVEIKCHPSGKDFLLKNFKILSSNGMNDIFAWFTWLSLRVKFYRTGGLFSKKKRMVGNYFETGITPEQPNRF